MEKTSARSPIAGDSTEEVRESMVRGFMLLVVSATGTHDTGMDNGYLRCEILFCEDGW